MSTRDIAREILMYDISQIEYYENVVNNMVGRVLRNRGVVEKKDGFMNWWILSCCRMRLGG